MKQEAAQPVPCRYVGALEELLEPRDYDRPEAAGLVKLRIRVGPNGLEILADSPDPELLQNLLEQLARELGVAEIEAMLCG